MRHTLNKRDQIIYHVQKGQTIYLKKNHNFGIELTNTVAEAHDID